LENILQSTALNAPNENVGIEKINETSTDLDDEAPTETLVHGYIGS